MSQPAIYSAKNPVAFIDKFDNVRIEAGGTGLTYFLPNGMKIYYNPERIAQKRDLGLFSHVMARSKQRVKEGLEMPVVKPRFVNVSQRVAHEKFFAATKKRGLFEVDINSAYWEIAKKIDVVSPEMFAKYVNLTGTRKLVRNMAIGATAKKVDIYEKSAFEPPVYIETRKLITEPVFWNVAKVCDTAIINAENEAGENYLFSWVDNIFLQGNPEKILDCLEKQGHRCKVKQVEKISLLKGIIYVFFADGTTKNYHKPEKFNLISDIREYQLMNT